MKSKFTFENDGFGHDADLGFSYSDGAKKGAKFGAAAGSVVPGVGNVVGTAAGVVTGLQAALASSIFGGKDKDDKDEVHSKTVGSLPEALLNSNRLDDPQKAQQLAQNAVQMGLQGKSFNEIGLYLDPAMGYAPKGPYLPSDGAGYPWGQIYSQWKLAVKNAQAQPGSSNPFNAALSGGGTPKWLLPVAIGGGVIGIVGIVAKAAK